MWVYRAGGEGSSRQMINLDHAVAIQADPDRAFGGAEDAKYQIIAYYKIDDFMHQTHTYMKLMGNLTKEAAETLVSAMHDAMLAGSTVFELPEEREENRHGGVTDLSMSDAGLVVGTRGHREKEERTII